MKTKSGQTLSHLHLEKWPPFRRRYFQVHFHEWKWISNKIWLKFVLEGQIDNDTALIPIMAWRQAIIWNNTVPIHWSIYAALGQDGLICKHLHETHIFTQNVLMKKCRMLLKMLSIGVRNDVQLTWCDCLSSFLIWIYWKQRRIYRNYTLTIEYLHVIITRTNGARWGPFKTCLSDFEMHPRVYGVGVDDPLAKLVGGVRGTSLINSSYRAVCGVVDINSVRGITIEGLSWKRGHIMMTS